jgi:hypothetical protein
MLYKTYRDQLNERKFVTDFTIKSFLVGFFFTVILFGGWFGQVKAELDPTATSGFTATSPTGQEGKAVGKLAIQNQLTLRYEIENYIKQKFGKDGDRALKIAKCESGLRADAWGYNKNKTLDRGIFQLNSVHDHITNECSFNAKCNIDAAYQIYLRQGFTPWVCNNKV